MIHTLLFIIILILVIMTLMLPAVGSHLNVIDYQIKSLNDLAGKLYLKDSNDEI